MHLARRLFARSSLARTRTLTLHGRTTDVRAKADAQHLRPSASRLAVRYAWTVRTWRVAIGLLVATSPACVSDGTSETARPETTEPSMQRSVTEVATSTPAPDVSTSTTSSTPGLTTSGTTPATTTTTTEPPASADELIALGESGCYGLAGLCLFQPIENATDAYGREDRRWASSPIGSVSRRWELSVDGRTVRLTVDADPVGSITGLHLYTDNGPSVELFPDVILGASTMAEAAIQVCPNTEKHRSVIEYYLNVDWTCLFGPEGSIGVTMHFTTEEMRLAAQEGRHPEPGFSFDMPVAHQPISGFSISRDPPLPDLSETWSTPVPSTTAPVGGLATTPTSTTPLVGSTLDEWVEVTFQARRYICQPSSALSTGYLSDDYDCVLDNGFDPPTSILRPDVRCSKRNYISFDCTAGDHYPSELD